MTTALAPQAIREKIVSLEARMREVLAHGLAEEQDCPLKHHFAPGAYGREILLPKGSLVVGKIHKHAHLNIVSQGMAFVMTEDGLEAIQAPRTWVSTPGTKRVVYAQEDTVWTTVHLTNETDLAKIEEEIIAPSYEALDVFLFPAGVIDVMKIEEQTP